jgi:hypothetical protein
MRRDLGVPKCHCREEVKRGQHFRPPLCTTIFMQDLPPGNALRRQIGGTSLKVQAGRGGRIRGLRRRNGLQTPVAGRVMAKNPALRERKYVGIATERPSHLDLDAWPCCGRRTRDVLTPLGVIRMRRPGQEASPLAPGTGRPRGLCRTAGRCPVKLRFQNGCRLSGLC